MKSNPASFVAICILIPSVFLATIMLSAIIGKDSISRDTFYLDKTLENYSVYCNEKNEIALETYCRVIRAGAYPVHTKEEADIYIFIRRNILYVSDKSEEDIFLNIPLGEEYGIANGSNYLELMHTFITKFHSTPSHKKPTY